MPRQHPLPLLTGLVTQAPLRAHMSVIGAFSPLNVEDRQLGMNYCKVTERTDGGMTKGANHLLRFAHRHTLILQRD